MDQKLNLPSGRGDEARTGGGGPDRRDIYVPDLHIDTLKVKARNFR